ncbi:MAG: PHP domain-containing protein [Planctomycetota bacterium]
MSTPPGTARQPDEPAAFCDLHLHSTASDGTDAPQDLPRLCQAAGLSAFALTDHDTTAGVAACADAARKLKIDFVPGIELSANPDLDGDGRPVGSLHLLGHFIDPDHPHLAEISERLRLARAERNPLIIEKLNQLGVRITYDEVLELAAPAPGNGALGRGAFASISSEQVIVGRPHIGQVLVNKGYVKSIHEAFAKYIGSNGAAYARRDLLSAAEAIEAIHAAGGRATLAHPVQLELANDAELEHTVARLVDLGLDGIETRHSDHTAGDVKRFGRLAERFKLLTTGGSDYHGSRKSIALGSQRVPWSVYDQLRSASATA